MPHRLGRRRIHRRHCEMGGGGEGGASAKPGPVVGASVPTTTTTLAPTTTTTQPPPTTAPPNTAAPAGCHPLTDSGNCYQAGGFAAPQTMARPELLRMARRSPARTTMAGAGSRGDGGRREADSFLAMVFDRGDGSNILDAIVAEGRFRTCGTPWDRVVNVDGKRPVKVEGGCPNKVCVLATGEYKVRPDSIRSFLRIYSTASRSVNSPVGRPASESSVPVSWRPASLP